MSTIRGREIKDGGHVERGAFVYQATVYVERGWWLVHAVDIGRQTRVSTLGEVEGAAKHIYASHFGCSIDDVSIELSVYRTRPDAVVRAVWRRIARVRGI